MQRAVNLNHGKIVSLEFEPYSWRIVSGNHLLFNFSLFFNMFDQELLNID